MQADGFRVAVADLDADPGLAPAHQVGDPGLLAVPVDVTNAESAAAMCDQVLGRWGRIDVLVNNAGIAGPTRPVADYPPDAWQRVIAVNLTGVFHCTRACLPTMTAQGYGRIVSISSIAGKDGNPDMSAEERKLFLSRIPMGRMGTAAELAELVSWLASERCSFSTGAAFDLSGGRAVY